MPELLNSQDFIKNLVNEAQVKPNLRAELLNNPKKVIEQKLNFRIPDHFEIAVHEDTPRVINIVLPLNSEELNEIELNAVSGAGCYAYVPQCEHGPCPTALD